MAQLRDSKNLVSAGVAIVLGLAIAIHSALNYPLGTVTQMGPGFLPTVIGALIAALGLVLAVATVLAPEAEPIEIDWRPLLFVSVALVVFGLTLERLGLVPAIVLLVAVASLAEPGFRPRLIAGLSLFLIVMTALIFVYGLNTPLELFAGFPG
jgi:uncharacterized membrane protein YidH (DUF202 family)